MPHMSKSYPIDSTIGPIYHQLIIFHPAISKEPPTFDSLATFYQKINHTEHGGAAEGRPAILVIFGLLVESS